MYSPVVVQVYSLIAICTTLLYGILLSIQDLTSVQQPITTIDKKTIVGQYLVVQNLLVFFFPIASFLLEYARQIVSAGIRIEDILKKIVETSAESAREAEKWIKSVLPRKAGAVVPTQQTTLMFSTAVQAATEEEPDLESYNLCNLTDRTYYTGTHYLAERLVPVVLPAELGESGHERLQDSTVISPTTFLA